MAAFRPTGGVTPEFDGGKRPTTPTAMAAFRPTGGVTPESDGGKRPTTPTAMAAFQPTGGVTPEFDGGKRPRPWPQPAESNKGPSERLSALEGKSTRVRRENPS